MSDDQDRCEWVSVSSGTGLPGLSRTCVRVRVRVRVHVCVIIGTTMWSWLYASLICLSVHLATAGLNVAQPAGILINCCATHSSVACSRQMWIVLHCQRT